MKVIVQTAVTLAIVAGLTLLFYGNNLRAWLIVSLEAVGIIAFFQLIWADAWVQYKVAVLKNLFTDESEPEKIGKFEAYTAMVVTVAIITLVVCSLLFLLGWLNWIVVVATAGIIGTYLVLEGLVKIPVANEGVILILGERTKYSLKEGEGWVFPHLMKIVTVSLAEQVTRIGEEKPFVVTTIAKITITTGTGDKERKKRVTKVVPMHVRITLTWRICNARRYLDIGPKAVEEGLVDLAVKTVRQKASKIADVKFLQATDEVEQELKKHMVEEPKDGQQGKTPLERWGIKVHGVLVPKIMFADPELQKAYENVAKEMAEYESELREAQLSAAAIKLLVDAGMDPDDAAAYLQRERGKIKDPQEVILTRRTMGGKGQPQDQGKSGGGILGGELIEQTIVESVVGKMGKGGGKGKGGEK